MHQWGSQSARAALFSFTGYIFRLLLIIQILTSMMKILGFIYLKKDIHQDRKAEVNITFKGRYFLLPNRLYTE